MWQKIKKLIRESNPLAKKQTFIDKCLSGQCGKVKENLNILLSTITSDKELRAELGLTKEEYDVFIESEEPFDEFKKILIERTLNKY